MALNTHQAPQTSTQPLVKITELDHIVLRVSDVERALEFYTNVLGLTPERVEKWRAGDIRFPSARLNADTIIDFFGSEQSPVGREDAKNQDHFCMVIEPTDMESLKTKFESIGVDIQAGPGTRWGSHGDGMSLYIYDPDDNVVELRHY